MDSNDNNQYAPQELTEFRKALIAKRQDLTQSQANQLDALNSQGGHHLADLEEMGDSADTDSLCEIMDVSSSTIEQIDLALEKIQKGTYGNCEACKESIHRARLKYLPFANLCIECQRKQEAEQSFSAEPAKNPFEELS